MGALTVRKVKQVTAAHPWACWHAVKRTTVELSDELDARLRHEAARRGIPMSDLPREAIEAHVGRRTLRSFGTGRNGRPDISERIEEILASEADPACS